MKKYWAGCCGLLMLAGRTTSGALAADIAVSKSRVAPRDRYAVVRVESDCIRWVRQTQSWYNYCEPVPYYGFPPSHYEWGWNWTWGPPLP